MYGDRPYGDILREERERNGYDLNQMSRRLHIRPDILMSIEQSDFDRMPARGYSKNMVRAYARALNLDEREITDMFLDQAHMHDVGDPRRTSSSGYTSRSASRNRSYNDGVGGGGYSRRRGRESSYSSRSIDFDSNDPSRSSRRDSYSSDLPRDRAYSRDVSGRGAGRSRASERDRADNGRSRINAGSILQSFTNRRNNQETKVGRSFDTIGSNPPYARNNVGGTNALSGMNLPLLLIIVAALIVLIIVVVVVTNGSQQAVQDVPDIPISGLTDTSGTDSSGSDSADDDVVPASSIVLPESAEVVLDVADGQDSWIEVYENGSSTPSMAEVVSGPSSQAFDVDKSIKIRTANPSAVTVTLEGDEVKLASEGNGNYSYTFDFNDYLKKWKKDNGVDDEPSSKSSKSSKSSSSKSSSS